MLAELSHQPSSDFQARCVWSGSLYWGGGRAPFPISVIATRINDLDLFSFLDICLLIIHGQKSSSSGTWMWHLLSLCMFALQTKQPYHKSLRLPLGSSELLPSIPLARASSASGQGLVSLIGWHLSWRPFEFSGFGWKEVDFFHFMLFVCDAKKICLKILICLVAQDSLHREPIMPAWWTRTIHSEHDIHLTGPSPQVTGAHDSIFKC